jgi:hypothetical protein
MRQDRYKHEVTYDELSNLWHYKLYHGYEDGSFNLGEVKVLSESLTTWKGCFDHLSSVYNNGGDQRVLSVLTSVPTDTEFRLFTLYRPSGTLLSAEVELIKKEKEVDLIALIPF